MNDEQMSKALAHAVRLAVSSSDAALTRARERLLSASPSLDQKRSQAWCEFGWPTDVTNEMLYRLYRRGGIAHGAISKIGGACWRTPPELVEGDESDRSSDTTSWEKAASSVMTAELWSVWKEADVRRMATRYSGLILHVADNQSWDQPVTRASSALVGLTPVWASALKPVDLITDTASPDYGKPRRWSYTEDAANGSAGRMVDVHPDRIFILGDWRSDAIGFLEPAFNAFVSLEKVEGGSGESFLKNASRQISVSFDKDINLQSIASVYGVDLAGLQEKFNEAAREINRGNDQMLITQGATVSPLVSPVADPQPTYDVNLQTAAAALDIPTKVLVGMQTGERASTEDQRYFNDRCQSRRGDLAFEIKAFVRQLIRIKVLKPIAQFAVLWDDLNEQTAGQKLDSAERMSKINAAALDPSAEPFTMAEIRVAAGYEPEKPTPQPRTEDD